MNDRHPTWRVLLASMVRQAAELRLPQTASSLTLLTLLAIVPMAALGLAGLSALPAFQPLRTQVERFLVDQLFLPSIAATVVRYVNEFVVAAEQLSAVGTVLFLASALMAMLTVDRTLNEIWRTPRPRPLGQRLLLYWAMLTLGPVALGFALALQVQVASRLADASLLVEAVAAVLPSGLTVAVLAVLYRAAPNTRVRWRDALVGAAVATLLLLGLKRLLGAWLTTFTTYTVVYGAFAALPLLLSWLFAVWLSVLFGAVLAANLPHRGDSPGTAARGSPQAEFERLVAVLGHLLRDVQVPTTRLRALFGGDGRVAERIGALLANQGFLVRTWPAGPGGRSSGVWDEVWFAAPGLAAMTLRPLFDRCWRGAAAAANPLRPDPGGPSLTRPLGDVLQDRAAPARLRTGSDPAACP